MKGKRYATIEDRKEKFETEADGDTKKRVSEVFRGLEKNAGLSVL